MFGGKRSKPIQVFKIIVGSKATRACPIEHIDSIANDAGGQPSLDLREQNRPQWATYVFPSKQSRQRFMRILQGRYGSVVTMMLPR